MSQAIKGVIGDAGEALTLIERFSEASFSVVLIVVICLLVYKVRTQEKSYISVNKKLGRAKSIMTADLSSAEKISAIEAEKRVYELLEKN